MKFKAKKPPIIERAAASMVVGSRQLWDQEENQKKKPRLRKEGKKTTQKPKLRPLLEAGVCLRRTRWNLQK